LFYGRLFLRRNSKFNHLNYDPADLLEVDGTADLFSECAAKSREAGNRLTSIGEIVSRDGEPIHLRYNRLHWVLLPAKVAPSQGTDVWVGGYYVAVYGENGFTPTALVLLGEGDEAIAHLVEMHKENVEPMIR
jgi:hypothetical protein